MQPRPAATVIVARDTLAGVEVLALRRSSSSRFAPGFLVFPGGVLEPDDQDLAVRLFGQPGEAPRACAVRELYEEAGFLLTRAGLQRSPPDHPIDEIVFDPPTTDALPEVARWVAPEFLEVRFDARFYAAASPPGLEPVPDGSEIDRAWWARPGEVLAAAERGEAPLMWPTLVMLRELDGCDSVADVLALQVPQVPRDPSVDLPRP